MRARFVLKHADGRYYSFTDWINYDGYQFSRSHVDAKKMSAQGAATVKRILASRKHHGETFEIIPESELSKP